MARRYLFVYDPRDRSFPERWCVPNAADDATAPPTEEITGWIVDPGGFETVRAGLRARYPAPLEVEEMHATSWSALARNYPGMRR